MKKIRMPILCVVLTILIAFTLIPHSAEVAEAVATHFRTYNLLVKGEFIIASAMRAEEGDYSYMGRVDDDGFTAAGVDTGGGMLIGGEDEKTYGFGILIARPSGTAASGDSNDAGLKVDVRNFADNDTDYILRGINSTVSNRTNGEVGQLDNLIGSSNKIGNAPAVNTLSPYIWGLSIIAENYGLCTTEFGGLRVRLLNEGTVAATEYGIRISNLNASIADAVGSAILIDDAGANTGFDNGIDMSGASIVQAEMVFSNGAKFFVGTASGENAVYAEVGTYDATGSFYLSSDGKLFIQVADNGANADWETVTQSSAE